MILEYEETLHCLCLFCTASTTSQERGCYATVWSDTLKLRVVLYAQKTLSTLYGVINNIP